MLKVENLYNILTVAAITAGVVPNTITRIQMVDKIALLMIKSPVDPDIFCHSWSLG